MYTHEFKTAVVERLVALPAVMQVNYLQYWGEQIFFVALDPWSDDAEQSARAALASLLAELGAHAPKARLRFSRAGDHLPSSATLYRKGQAVVNA